jgi:hypothetical protein
MNSEFFLALDEIEKDKGIPKVYMLEKNQSGASCGSKEG